MFIDLDRLKNINDNLSDALGDNYAGDVATLMFMPTASGTR